MKRVVVPELLDDDLGTPDEIRDSLLDLRGINRKFGGVSSMARMLSRCARRANVASVSWLDVAGGTGDVAQDVTHVLRAAGINVGCTILDRATSHMGGSNSHLRVAGDALALPFGDASFDVVSCNLFCHHLEPAELRTFFSEALRVCRVAVIASDLRRSWTHRAAAYVSQPVFRSRLTKHDAVVSIRRSYTMPEIAALARQSSAIGVEVHRHFFQRFGLILWKQAA
jgi:ubiquinone/menaquinone biosynthesis C-methylase UbiE